MKVRKLHDYFGMENGYDHQRRRVPGDVNIRTKKEGDANGF
jgi:hypothetical protein